MKKRQNEIIIKKSILNPIEVYFNHQYLYKSLHIVLSNKRKRIQLNLNDNYEKNFGVNSINKALIQLDKIESKYLHLREYKNSGFAACVSDKYENTYVSNDRYRQITIPINEYNNDYIAELLIDMMMARMHYTNYRLKTAKIDSNKNMILASNQSELIIKDWDTHIILPIFEENKDAMYQLAEDCYLKGWYKVTSLSTVNTNENNMRSVIMTRKELEDNIIALLEYNKIYTA